VGGILALHERCFEMGGILAFNGKGWKMGWV
jgi:hypothetical protein